jgi:hypothetical protein
MNREDAYRIIADMVFKGFLSMHVDLAGSRFIFKTLNNREYDLIKYYSGLPSNPYYGNIFNSYYMAFSVFMVGSENVLLDRDKKVPELASFFNQMSGVFCKTLIKELEALRSKMYEALDFIEGFSYSSQYRRTWRAMGLNFMDKVPGTENLGLNVFQENWILINKSLDEEETYNERFSIAVLIASATNAKGAKHLRAKHDAGVQTAEDKRKKLAKEGTMEKISWSEQGWAAPVDTAEELVAELNRQMSGYKDKHDKLVEAYLYNLEKEAEEHNKKVQQQFEESNKKHEGESPISGGQRALTPDEAKELMSRKDNNLVILPPEDIASDEESKRYLTKIGGKVLTGRR